MDNTPISTANSSPARSMETDREKPLIEMENMMNVDLPPEWVERYEQCTDLIREIDQLSKAFIMQKKPWRWNRIEGYRVRKRQKKSK